jgi:hypothetical protein
MVVGDGALPGFQHDRSAVLRSGSVLREQTQPMLRAAPPRVAAGPAGAGHPALRQDGPGRLLHLAGDPGPVVGAVDRQGSGIRSRGRDVPVSEVRAEQVRIRGRLERLPVAPRAALRDSRHAGQTTAAATPVLHRAPRNPQPAADLRRVEPGSRELERGVDGRLGVHERQCATGHRHRPGASRPVNEASWRVARLSWIQGSANG